MKLRLRAGLGNTQWASFRLCNNGDGPGSIKGVGRPERLNNYPKATDGLSK